MKNNKKLNKKLLLVATSAALVVPVIAITNEGVVDVEAATIKLSEKQQGDIIKLGGVEYVVISHKYGGVLVQSKNIIEPYGTYDLYNNQLFDLNDSTNVNIGSYLNNVYYNSLPADVQKLIKTVDWHIGNEKNESAKTVSAKIGLLTHNDWISVGKYYGGKIETSQQGLEWLMNPVDGDSNAIWSLRPDGELNPYIHSHNQIGVKAAFVLDLDYEVDSDGNVSEPEKSPIAPSEPIDLNNGGTLTNGSVNLNDIFDDENPGDLSFKPNILVNEPEADIYIQSNLLMIENPKQKGIISVEVEATNLAGKTATAVLNMTIDESDVVTNPETGSSEGKDSKVTLRLVEGEFTLKTDNITSFGTVKLTTAKQTVTTDFAGDFGVIDARGTQEGWNVTVSATPFTVETFDGFVGTPHQLPIGSLALNSVTGIERLNHVNQADGLPSSLMQTATVIDTNNALSILNANQGEGLGEFKFTFGPDALALTVDAVTAKIDKVNYPDQNTPYASTVTWDLVSGPQI